MRFNKHPERSALVDLVMKDATEKERIEATRNWFGFLGVMLKIAKEEEHRKMRAETDTPEAET